MATTAGTFAESPVAIRVDHLLRTARDGNDLAFEELVRLYRNDVYRIALGLLSHPDEASQVTHNVFVSLFHSLARLGGDRNLRLWLRRMALNRCYDILRHRKRPDDASARLMPGCMLGDEPIKPADMTHLIQQSLDILPTRERAALVLTGQIGYSSEETARIMGCSASTVRHLAIGARNRIRSLFMPGGVAPSML